MGDGVSKWRGMEDRELAQLQAIAKDRARLASVEQRRLLKTPEAADNSLGGALYWAWVVLRQDHPAFVVIATILLLWQSVRTLAGFFGIEMI